MQIQISIHSKPFRGPEKPSKQQRTEDSSATEVIPALTASQWNTDNILLKEKPEKERSEPQEKRERTAANSAEEAEEGATSGDMLVSGKGPSTEDNLRKPAQGICSKIQDQEDQFQKNRNESEQINSSKRLQRAHGNARQVYLDFTKRNCFSLTFFIEKRKKVKAIPINRAQCSVGSSLFCSGECVAHQGMNISKNKKEKGKVKTDSGSWKTPPVKGLMLILLKSGDPEPDFFLGLGYITSEKILDRDLLLPLRADLQEAAGGGSLGREKIADGVDHTDIYVDVGEEFN
ncbi:hypothetical protein E2I00_019091 [Balaenoptera physalus]|uniref:Uncharacterized protein n=1 Tax=Balaenoptera physalus TaxID=9770 RepID=A0A643BU53_BALPH|nr:hypothetical protein E2I00_019091 [Balaenoptera physalus]